MEEKNESGLSKSRVLKLEGSLGNYQLIQLEHSPYVGVYEIQTGKYLGGFGTDEKTGKHFRGYPMGNESIASWSKKSQDAVAAFNKKGGLEEFSKLPLEIPKYQKIGY